MLVCIKCICIYICMHISMYVFMYVCMHACMCVYVCRHACVCMYIGMYVRVHVCMYVRTYVYKYVRTHLLMKCVGMYEVWWLCIKLHCNRGDVTLQIPSSKSPPGASFIAATFDDVAGDNSSKI